MCTPCLSAQELLKVREILFSFAALYFTENLANLFRSEVAIKSKAGVHLSVKQLESRETSNRQSQNQALYRLYLLYDVASTGILL